MPSAIAEAMLSAIAESSCLLASRLVAWRRMVLAAYARLGHTGRHEIVIGDGAKL